MLRRQDAGGGIEQGRGHFGCLPKQTDSADCCGALIVWTLLRPWYVVLYATNCHSDNGESSVMPGYQSGCCGMPTFLPHIMAWAVNIISFEILKPTKPNSIEPQLVWRSRSKYTGMQTMPTVRLHRQYLCTGLDSSSLSSKIIGLHAAKLPPNRHRLLLAKLESVQERAMQLSQAVHRISNMQNTVLAGCHGSRCLRKLRPFPGHAKPLSTL